MKILKTLIAALVLTATVSLVSAADQYDVRFHNVNCNNDKVYVDIQIKASNMGETFNLSEQNYRFTFNGEAIVNPTIVQELQISGAVNSSFYNQHSLRGSKANVVSYNVELAGGEGYLLDDDWVNVGRLSFDVVDNTQCLELTWQNTEQFPPTYVGKATDDSRVSATAVTFNNFEDCEFCSTAVGTEDVLSNVAGFDVYPNPTIGNEEVSVTFTATQAQDATLLVTDIMGKTVLSRKVNLNAGDNILPLKHRNLNTGTYLIQIQTGNEVTAAKKFVKLKR